jgi:alpha-tubulin suppressor-like RCC1 family protein
VARRAVCWGHRYDFGHLEPEGLRYQEIGVGWDHVCAITLQGALVCWGSNEWNQATPPDLPPP